MQRHKARFAATCWRSSMRRAATVEVAGIVWIEVGADPGQHEQEASLIAGLAADDPRVMGMVAAAPLEHGDGGEGGPREAGGAASGQRRPPAPAGRARSRILPAAGLHRGAEAPAGLRAELRSLRLSPSALQRDRAGHGAVPRSASSSTTSASPRSGTAGSIRGAPTSSGSRPCPTSGASSRAW